MPLACKDEDPFDDDPLGPIVREIQRGIRLQENYRRLCEYFRPGLLRYFVYKNFPVKAEDLCQEVFFKVYEGIPSFEFRSRFSCWVYRIARNVLANELRRQGARVSEVSWSPAEEDAPEREPGFPDTGPSPFDVAATREFLTRLRAALESLPPQMRRCFYLRVYQGLRFREVAEVMHVTLDTVKAQLGEARKRLRPLLSDDGGIMRRLDENHE